MLTQYRDIILKTLKIQTTQIKEYPSSYVKVAGDELILCKIGDVKKILAIGQGILFSTLEGDSLSDRIKLCPLSHQNRLVLNQYLPYTLPSAFGRQIATLGFGDRLGLATPGHIRSIQNCNAKPVLAQQSRRELDLTGRSYEQVLDDVCFAVFQEGYQGGFGADGDHLKKVADIEEALRCGYTMITLDCSEKIGRGIENLSDHEAAEIYEKLSSDYRARVEDSYLSKGFLIGGETYYFDKKDLIRCVLIYHEVIDFVKEIYFDYLKKTGQVVDYELSIDETESITTSLGHLFVAMELEYNKIEVTSLAPRFVGEFQKGIDYIGDMDAFENHLKQHAAIADHFGYKLSIHSGSDKFRVFPMIGDYTGGRFHLKTSGTSWLEALGTIAEQNPLLYRNIHRMALNHFSDAKIFYKVFADPDKVVPLNLRKDEELSDYLKNDDSRQLLHITYGFILGDPVLKEAFYHTLEANEEHYYERLVRHLGRHLDLICLNN